NVAAGKALRIEYFRTFFQDWDVLEEVVSDGVTQTHFVQSSMPLPADGYGNDLRLRLTAVGTDGSEQWHIDDISLTPDGGCYADCDGSGGLDFFDFLCFQNEFAAGSAEADCDGSGGLDFFDFLCFQNEFAAGCPLGAGEGSRPVTRRAGRGRIVRERVRYMLAVLSRRRG